MSRLLFCWELGANFGHLANIAALRRDLLFGGHTISFAVADLKVAREILGNDVTLYQAPVWPRYQHMGSRVAVASFTDVLTMVGFGDPVSLAPVVDAYLALFAHIAPDIVIADHSPAAQLATRIAGRRLITMGTGFTQPPLEYASFPPLRADIAPALTEAHLLATANAVLADRGLGEGYATLSEVFRADARIVIGLPELDPYRSFRREPFASPVGGFAPPSPVAERRIFAYLGAEMPELAAKIQVLCDLPIAADIYVRGADQLLLDFIRLRGKTAHEKPANMHQVLGRATHVISQGGAMTASEALAAGRPHLFIPLHQETQMNTSIVLRAGFGRAFDASDTDPTQFRRAVLAFVADRDLEERTLDFAKVLADRPLPDAGLELMQALSRLAQGRNDAASLPAPSMTPLS